MMNQNVSNQLVVMTKDDLEAAVIKIASNMRSGNEPLVQVPTIIKETHNNGEEHFLTRKEVSNLFKADLSTLWRWNKSGLLPSIKVGPRKVMYRYSDVMIVLSGGSCAKNK